MKFYPYENMGGGAEKVLPLLKVQFGVFIAR